LAQVLQGISIRQGKLMSWCFAPIAATLNNC
jgi:hypothetical protein